MKNFAKSAAKFFLKKVFGEYSCFRIFRLDLEPQRADVELAEPYHFAELQERDLLESDDELIRSRAWYAGSEAKGFGIFCDKKLVCIQWFWFGERYRTRDSWPLESHEAKSVELATIEAERGKGLATKLKQYSAQRMREAGFVRLYSRIWFSNRPSILVSKKAGWRHIATVIEVHPLGLSKTWKITYPKRRHPR